MMYSELKITKAGLFDGNQDVSTQLMDYLCDGCKLEDGLTFKDLLNLVEPYTEQLSMMLTNGPWLKDLIEEGKKPVVDDDDTKIEYLEVCRAAEINRYSNQDELTEYATIHGIGDGGPWALGFSPTNSLTAYELRLNEEVSIYDWRSWKPGRESSSKGPPVLATVRKPFTLLEILYGVFWELSFHGAPADRDARMESLNDTIKRIDSGEEKLIPWEDVKRELGDLDEELDDSFNLDTLG
jgi:hypothetical protein